MLLGVAFHATMSFLPGPQIWVVRDTPSPSLGALFVLLHMFRMILFFLVAGFFGRMLIEKRGAAGFVRNRGVRVLLPLLVFWLPLSLAMLACFVWGAAQMNGGVAPPNMPPPPAITWRTFPLTHLWFLYVLTVFYLGALVIRKLPGRWFDGPVSFVLGRPFAGMVMAIPMIAAMALKPDWIPSLGIPTPDTGLIPNSTALIGYGTAFTFGWLLQRQMDLLSRLARTWAHHLSGAAILSTALILLLGGTVPNFAPEPDAGRRLLLAAIYGLGAWCWTFGLLGPPYASCLSRSQLPAIAPTRPTGFILCTCRSSWRCKFWSSLWLCPPS
ncbi:acyltransferase family protein [Sphingomonas piscis]|uniref:Acyltransferase family protein n=1 Tax=Sphingomonas piscis TaxID=2714943 RepID=A0A6G7YMN2_9SPHN|nr:acyltransferase family protein [Sphingomonas piscis]QIK78000.1 acyltransferase family protein [Sphingomonas piscis]